MSAHPAPGDIRRIQPDEAERLIAAGAVEVLDVRTPEEYAGLGHIPGAALVPLALIASAAGSLPRDGRPVLVVCEHGIRSAAAAQFLARAGIVPVLDLAGGMSVWRGPREHAPGTPCGPFGPSSWLLSCADLLPPGARVLDLACGRGRHALLLAAAGFDVDAVDIDEAKLDALRAAARGLGVALEARRLDLEAAVCDLGTAAYDVILGIHYLHRPLFPALAAALRPGGLLLYETFTRAQAARGKPTNPDYLLEPGELERLAAPLEVVRMREGEYEGRHVAGVAALKAPEPRP